MEISNEDKVTKILSMNEILENNDLLKIDKKISQPILNSKYDLSQFLETEIQKEKNYRNKYLFVR